MVPLNPVERQHDRLPQPASDTRRRDGWKAATGADDCLEDAEFADAAAETEREAVANDC